MNMSVGRGLRLPREGELVSAGDGGDCERTMGRGSVKVMDGSVSGPLQLNCRFMNSSMPMDSRFFLPSAYLVYT
jgi:hypothetical protein